MCARGYCHHYVEEVVDATDAETADRIGFDILIYVRTGGTLTWTMTANGEDETSEKTWTLVGVDGSRVSMSIDSDDDGETVMVWDFTDAEHAFLSQGSEGLPLVRVP